jgi:hypothetical protein
MFCRLSSSAISAMSAESVYDKSFGIGKCSREIAAVFYYYYFHAQLFSSINNQQTQYRNKSNMEIFSENLIITANALDVSFYLIRVGYRFIEHFQLSLNYKRFF